MKLTPLDIKKQEFKRVLRGYDPVEVDSFMDMMSNEFIDLLRENKEMKEQIIEMEVQLRDFKQIERTLQQTLMQAQEASGKSIENARREAQLTVQEAEQKANQLLDRARLEVMRAKEDVAILKSKRESIISRLKVLLNSEIELIKALEIDDGEIDDIKAKSPGKSTIAVDDIVKNL